jgi:hypothetical protein
MRTLARYSLLALAATAVPARAEVFVQTPWACIRVGRPAPTRVVVQTPWVTVGVSPSAPAAAPAAPPAAEPVYVPGAPPPVPLPIPVDTAPAGAPTLSEFAATFRPKGGRFEVDVVHPATGRPVRVSFTLPEGTPRRVKVHRREVDFDYGGKQVSIRFLRGGEVRVRD